MNRRRALFRGSPGFFRRRVDRLLSLVDDLGGGLFHLADGLIFLSFSRNFSLSVNAPAASLIRPFTSSLLPDMIESFAFAENKGVRRLPDNAGWAERVLCGYKQNANAVP